DEDSSFWRAIENDDLDELSQSLDQFGAGRASLNEVLPALRSWRQSLKARSLLDECRYQVEWRRPENPHRTPRPGTWIVVVSAEDRAQWVEETLTVLADPKSGVEYVVLECAGTERQEVGAELEAVVAGQDVAGVLSLLSREADEAHDLVTAPTGYAATLAVMQALGDLGCVAPLWCVTRGAVSVEPGDVLESPVQGLMLGLGRVAALEMPERWGGLVDLPSALDESSVALLADVLEYTDEDEIAIRADGVFARRLVRAKLSTSQPEPWVPEGTVVVTGGTGRIGSAVARWLAEQGAPRLLLLSRSGMSAPGAAELYDELRALGSRVDIVACDISDRVGLQRVWTSNIGEEPVRAVFHTAAVLDDAPIDALTMAQVNRTMAVKVGGARNLHELAQEAGVDKFVLFSSLGATLGVAGQGNYAPGNAFLDALAEARRAHGLAGMSIAWGAWAGGGMASTDTVRDGLQRHGVLEMGPELTIAGLSRTVNGGDSNITFAQIDWDKLSGVLRPGGKATLVYEIPEVPVSAYRDETVSASEGHDLQRLLASLDENERRNKVAVIVSDCLKSVLGYQNVDAERSFKELGADSLSSIQLRNALRAATGLSFSGTLIFDYPTPALLTEHIEKQLG
ncbi:SDR family NAD(P)-dependent oxidoreductase, partial [Nocardia salmonicida]|uniref:SDR family NAD(P)-dependent oxidoreductase n=1 Tax=Nocardia salmonicida TaxID=53431 RepID=UPI000AEC3FFD